MVSTLKVGESGAACGVRQVLLTMVELATLEWVSWFNHHRLLEPIGYIPPAEAEENYWRQRNQAQITTEPAKSAALQEG